MNKPILSAALIVWSTAMPCQAASPASWILNPPDLETIVTARPGEDSGTNLRQTADGGYIVAGCVTVEGRGREMAVFKFRPDLSPDPQFGHEGLWVFGGTGTDLAIDVIEVEGEDGEPRGFLVVGVADVDKGGFGDFVRHGKIDVVLARLTPRGEPDPDFGEEGIRFYGGSDDDEVVVHLHNYSEPGQRLVQTPDGFIVASMTRSSDGDLAQRAVIGKAGGRDAMIFAIDKRGEYLPGFGDRGILRIGSIPGAVMGRRSPNEFVWSIAPDPRGGFVASGYHLGAGFLIENTLVPSPGNSSGNGDNTSRDVKQHKMDGWVFRFDKQGQLVDDWADHGLSFIGGSWQEKIYDVLPVDDGYLVTGRTASWDLEFSRPQPSAATFDRVLLKLDRAGRLDPDFGENGLILAGGDGDDQALRIAELRAGGDLIWLSQSTSRPLSLESVMPRNYHRQAVLTRLSPSGIPLQNWSLGEKGEEKPVGFIIDRERRIVIVGFRNPNVLDEEGPDNPSGRDLLIMRFRP